MTTLTAVEQPINKPEQQTLSKEEEEAKRLHSSSSSHASSGVSSGVTSSRNANTPSQDSISSGRNESGDISAMTNSIGTRISKSTSDDNDESTRRLSTVKQPLPEGYAEDRFRVDRKRLENLLSQSVKIDKNNSSNTNHLTRAEVFFMDIINSTGCQVSWPSRLKIGAKSKKDPHIKITGLAENVKIAKEKIMEQLDSKSSRVTIKMDVSHTDHSHVIGKGGANIKQVMSETECHIHFPDSNRNSFITEKSNQVSIAGQAAGVEKARQRIRDLLPITMYFDFHTKHLVPIDLNTPAIQNIVQTYNISVQIKSKKPYINVIQVKGCVSNTLGLKDGVICLMQLLTGQIGQSLPVRSNVEIQNVASFMNAKNIAKIKQIQNTTGIHIELPSLEPSEFHARNLSNRRLSSGPDQPIIIDKQVVMTGTIEGILYARQEIINNLPLVLMFDLKTEVSPQLAQETGEQFECFISIKSKAKQATKSCIIKSSEANVYNMFKARQKLTNLPNNGLEDIQMPINTASFLFTQMQNNLYQPIAPVQMMHYNRTPNNFRIENTQQQPKSNVGWRNFGSKDVLASNEPVRLSRPLQIQTKSCNTQQNENDKDVKENHLKGFGSRTSSRHQSSNSSKSDNTSQNKNSSITRQPHPPPTATTSSCHSSYTSSKTSLEDKSLDVRTTSSKFSRANNVTNSSELFSQKMDKNCIDKKSLQSRAPGAHRKTLSIDKCPRVESRESVSSLQVNGNKDISREDFSSGHECVSSDLSDNENNRNRKNNLSRNSGVNGSVVSESFYRPVASAGFRNAPPGFSLKPSYTPQVSIVSNVNNLTNSFRSGEKRLNKPNVCCVQVKASDEECKGNDKKVVSIDDKVEKGKKFGGVKSSPKPRVVYKTLKQLFKNFGLEKYTESFVDQEIDLVTFATMTESDFGELGVKTFGARRKMVMAIKELNNQSSSSTTLNTSNYQNNYTNTAKLTLTVGR